MTIPTLNSKKTHYEWTEFYDGKSYSFKKSAKAKDAPFITCYPLLPQKHWQCPDCGTKDSKLRYPGTTMQCQDCAIWLNINHNSYNSYKSYTVELTRTEFQQWLDSQERKCHYCGIPQEYLAKVKVKSSKGKLVEVIGVDRNDSTTSYTKENMIMSCLGCNRIKSDLFTYDEMKNLIAPSIRTAWLLRLGFTAEDIEKDNSDKIARMRKEKKK